MNNTIPVFRQSTFTWAFWRLAAYIAGFAVERKRLLLIIVAYTPFIVAGVVAYALGRAIGSAFLNGFAF